MPINHEKKGGYGAGDRPPAMGIEQIQPRGQVKMKKGRSISSMALFLLLFTLLITAYMVGCGGSSGGDGDPVVSPTVSPTTSPTTSPTVSPSPSPTLKKVSGMVRDKNGLPIQGSKATAVQKGQNGIIKAFEATTDTNGQFTINDITYSSFDLKIEKSGRKTVTVEGFGATGSYDALSITQPLGSGDTTIALPTPAVLSASASGSDAVLSWTQSSNSSFVSYMVMRASSPGVNNLSNNVGKFTDSSITSMTDRNLPSGTSYFRVFQMIATADSALGVASNEVSVTIGSEQAFPPNITMLMMKTLPASGGAVEHQARYVVTTNDIGGIIPSGKNITITSPLFVQAVKAQYAVMGYKKVKNYYYGNRALYLGEIRMPGEWESKYYVSKNDFAADDRIGTHTIAINNQDIDFALTTGMPNSKILNPQLSRNADGDLEVSWNMLEDGSPFTGGAGKYGWKYLVKVMYEGVYAGGNDPDYQFEKFWSNICIRDIGFNRICEVAVNMPQDAGNKMVIPDGIFDKETTVKISLYAISTTETATSPDSGVSGYGKAYMYWLYMGGTSVVVP